MTYVKFERVSLKHDSELNEAWVQGRIAEDPSLLGLGDVVVKDQQRAQPKAGRLDLLLQDAEESKRYEVEVQLGPTDESHIIRTIEYWDIERRRYPQYDHTAVIVAEDITSRFLNVISLFNGMIPLVAIQMSAFKAADGVGLVFTKVLDHMPLGLVGDDEEEHETTDRAYWEKRGSPKTVAMVDAMLDMLRQLDPDLTPKYNRFYVGLAKQGSAHNFVIFRPKKNFVRFEPRLASSEETLSRLEGAGLDIMDYDVRWGRYRIRLMPDDIKKHRDILLAVMTDAFNATKG